MATMNDQEIDSIVQILKSNPAELQSFMSQVQTIAQGGQQKEGFNVGRGIVGAFRAMRGESAVPTPKTNPYESIMFRELLERNRPKTATEQLSELKLEQERIKQENRAKRMGETTTQEPTVATTAPVAGTAVTPMTGGTTEEEPQRILEWTGKYDEYGEKIYAPVENQAYVTPLKRQENEQKQREAAYTLESATSIVDELLQDKDLEGLSGVGAYKSKIMGTRYNYLGKKIKQVADIASLLARQQIKGQGTVSDFEGRMLANAQSILANWEGLTYDDLKKELAVLRDMFNAKLPRGMANPMEQQPSSEVINIEVD